MLTGLRNLLWHSWFSIQHSWKRRTARKAAITKLERRTKQRAQRKGKKVVREGGDGGNGAGAPKATGLRARLPAIEPVSELDESPFTPHIVTGQPRPKPRKEFKLVPEHYHKIIAALEPPSPSDIVNSDADSERGIKLVEDTLRSFKIEAKVVNVKRGPVVTRYEVQPAPGIRVSRIVNLADDLALALAAIDVRVEAPVPGKSVIGIEVPNKRIALVRLREILELEDFKRSPSKLVFALGKDIAGNPKLADLSLMPHILIGGATNSGKSVCLNSMIVSILSRADPDEVKISLIDPKRVELSLFAGVPHLMHPVVVDTKHAISALRGAVREMERRYELFAEKGVRNIETYNANLEDDEELLYHIVIVIDELADL
ncbi:MAG TPA: DNA translocase FtsK, partial [Armatimonadetes bacterium]|nr:DNA translocase FtsK [Armatimonadota bacterium]